MDRGVKEAHAFIIQKRKMRFQPPGKGLRLFFSFGIFHIARHDGHGAGRTITNGVVEAADVIPIFPDEIAEIRIQRSTLA